MNVRLYVVVILCCLFTGCASPFQATWYFEQTDMYVAILNQSDQQQNVTNVILNQSKDKKDSGWMLSDAGANVPAIPLLPGELLIKPAKGFINDSKYFTDRCRVPVYVTVMTEQDKSGAKAEMAGRMPSLLPEGWEKCPNLEASKQ